MSHDELTKIAERWLLKAKGCAFVFRELHTMAYEIPDAIGFRGAGISLLVECKASRADFLSDHKKPHRREPHEGMGDYRFYMCPTGLIKADELPDKWGLIYVTEAGRARQIAGPRSNIYSRLARGDNASYRFDYKNEYAEKYMLMSALRRMHLRGLLPTIYEQEAIDDRG